MKGKKRIVLFFLTITAVIILLLTVWYVRGYVDLKNKLVEFDKLITFKEQTEAINNDLKKQLSLLRVTLKEKEKIEYRNFQIQKALIDQLGISESKKRLLRNTIINLEKHLEEQNKQHRSAIEDIEEQLEIAINIKGLDHQNIEEENKKLENEISRLREQLNTQKPTTNPLTTQNIEKEAKIVEKIWSLEYPNYTEHLNDQQKNYLQKVVINKSVKLLKTGQYTLSVEGYSPKIKEKEKENIKISNNTAIAVKNYLLNNGINKKNIENVVSYGALKLKLKGKRSRSAKNSRVDIILKRK